jgi:hypothetical protein
VIITRYPRPVSWGLCALLATGACSEGPVAPLEPPPLTPAETRAAVECTARVHSATVECAPVEPGALSANRILGGQNVNLRLVSTNAAYDSTAQVFGIDVTVENLLVQQMGTSDGVDTAGIVVFFAVGPTAASGAGAVSVRNADGEGMFTAGAQPYFHYPGVLPLNGVSTARRWEFNVPPSVQSFVFRVYVKTPLLPVVIFDRVVSGNRDVYRVALDGSDLVRLTTHAADELAATVGGPTMVWVSYRHGNADLYSRPLAGGAETRLTSTSGNESDPGLSRDGQRLAYVFDGVGGVGKVYVAAGDGAGTTRLTSAQFGFGGSPEVAPVWDPAGARLAFVGTAQGSADIYQALLPPGAALPLAPALLTGGNATAEVNPAYSRDGTRLAYATNLTGDGDVYVLHVESGVRTRITTRAGADANPSWLDDGRLVYLEYHPSSQGVLRWVDPDDPTRSGTIPLPPGGRPDRPRAVPAP